MSKLSLTFRIFKNGQLVRAEKLTQAVIKIGKVPSAHLQIDDESVSRMHAIIEVLGDDVSLIDLGSTRGTFVNGTRINKTKLQSGDTLTFGALRVEVGIHATEEAPVAVAPVATAVPPPLPPATMTMPAPVAARVAAPVAAPVPAPIAPRSTPLLRADEDEGGAGAVEVAAMLGDSVVNVKHCMDPRGGKVTRKTWGFFAVSLVCLVSSAVAFKQSVDTAAYNRDKLAYHTQVAKKPAFSYRPMQAMPGLDFLAFGGLALGLLGATAGLVRMRNEKKSPYFRIGTAAGVEQPLESAPSASFPLVAPSGDDFVFNFAPGIDGEMTVNGTTTSLAELAASGRARPSMTTAGAIELPIPPKARIRATSGNTTFLVSTVAQPRRQAAPGVFSFENRTMAYFAGSLAVHLGVWAFLQTVPMEDSGANIDLAMQETTSMNTNNSTKEDVPPPQEDGEVGNEGSEGTGAAMALAEGQSGNPNAKSADGHIRVKNNDKPPAISREAAIAAAREAGFLGSTASIDSAIHALAADADYSSGFDEANIYGPLFGAEGEGKGNFGGGRKDWGPGGGCMAPPCGIIGSGNSYDTIGTGPKAGDGWGPGRGTGGLKRRNPTYPDTQISQAIIGGDLDKSIIKRYINRNISKIAYCYEKQLLAKPGIAGTVKVQFLIAPNGSVQSSTGNGFDGEVSSCVAGVVKNISFPAPKNGGVVQVNYPFTFHAAGQ